MMVGQDNGGLGPEFKGTDYRHDPNSSTYKYQSYKPEYNDHVTKKRKLCTLYCTTTLWTLFSTSLHQQ